MKSFNPGRLLFIALGSFLMSCVLFAAFGWCVQTALKKNPLLLSQLEQKGIHLSLFGHQSNNFGTYIDDERVLEFDLPASRLEVSVISANVEITSTKHARVKVTLKGGFAVGEKTPLDVSVHPAELSLSEKKDGSTRDLVVRIEIPESYCGALAINTVSGDVQLRNAKVSSLNLNSVSGDLELRRVESKNYTFNSVSGDIKLWTQGLPDAQFDITTISGDFSTEIPSRKDAATKIDINTVSGDVEVKKEL